MASPSQCPFDYLLVLDFEATCQKDDRSWPNEIIEFPTVLLNCRTGQVEDEFHHYVQPKINKKLTAFCMELTGIQQDWVDSGVANLEQCLKLYAQWMEKHGLIRIENNASTVKRVKSFTFVTCGSWDLKTCLPRQVESQSVNSVLYKQGVFDQWINIKFSFERSYKGKRARGMDHMLKELGLTLDGRHHSGIDDCRNITKIVKHMLFVDKVALNVNAGNKKSK